MHAVANMRVVPMKARKGEPIVCSCGTVAGKLQLDIQDGAPITSHALGGLSYDGMIDGGYRCEKCHEPIALRRSERACRIRTSRGWVE